LCRNLVYIEFMTTRMSQGLSSARSFGAAGLSLLLDALLLLRR